MLLHRRKKFIIYFGVINFRNLELNVDCNLWNFGANHTVNL